MNEGKAKKTILMNECVGDGFVYSTFMKGKTLRKLQGETLKIKTHTQRKPRRSSNIIRMEMGKGKWCPQKLSIG